MKKILTILAAVAIFAACGTKSNEVETETDTIDSFGTVKTGTIVVQDSLIIITFQKDSVFKISK